MSQYWFCCYPLLQFVERILFFLSPLPFVVFLGEFVQRSRNECEVLDEWAIKIEESKYLSYFCCRFWYWPHVHACNFCRVHTCHPLFKDYPQVIHGQGMEETFFWFEVKVV